VDNALTPKVSVDRGEDEAKNLIKITRRSSWSGKSQKPIVMAASGNVKRIGTKRVLELESILGESLS